VQTLALSFNRTEPPLTVSAISSLTHAHVRSQSPPVVRRGARGKKALGGWCPINLHRGMNLFLYRTRGWKIRGAPSFGLHVEPSRKPPENRMLGTHPQTRGQVNSRFGKLESRVPHHKHARDDNGPGGGFVLQNIGKRGEEGQDLFRSSRHALVAGMRLPATRIAGAADYGDASCGGLNPERCSFGLWARPIAEKRKFSPSGGKRVRTATIGGRERRTPMPVPEKESRT